MNAENIDNIIENPINIATVLGTLFSICFIKGKIRYAIIDEVIKRETTLNIAFLKVTKSTILKIVANIIKTRCFLII